MRTSIPCRTLDGRKTPRKFEIMTVVSENSDENQQQMENGDCSQQVPPTKREKKISTISRVSKKSIQQKIYKKGKVKFDKSTKSYTKSTPRLVERSGSCNIVSRTINGKQTSIFTDFFTTLIETKWRLVLPIFGMSVIISWIAYAGIFYGISSAHGDFREDLVAGHKNCIANAQDFLLFYCFLWKPKPRLDMVPGLVIAKIQKPSKRGNTILFSKYICISQEHDGKYLSIRIADLQKSNMIETSTRAVCVVSTLTTDGDFISHFRHDMEFKLDKKYSRIQLQWPVVLTHRLQPHSPLYNMDEDDLRNSDLELIILMDGIIESTGMTVQTRTSYIPSEFQWQHKFKPMIANINTSGVCEFTLKLFHETEEIVEEISYEPYHKLRRINKSQSSKCSDYGRNESGFSEGIDTDVSSCCSDFSVFDAKYI
ncbi:KCNJN [Mytilus coruscus]|uniref:KCNJN n=1 Tax=Mytilus coruscus TaxID=42192 RepID=A0A6J8DMT0_MYTCO|nr:KCNJN [Mytilus coruscus]